MVVFQKMAQKNLRKISYYWRIWMILVFADLEQSCNVVSLIMEGRYWSHLWIISNRINLINAISYKQMRTKESKAESIRKPMAVFDDDKTNKMTTKSVRDEIMEWGHPSISEKEEPVTLYAWPSDQNYYTESINQNVSNHNGSGWTAFHKDWIWLHHRLIHRCYHYGRYFGTIEGTTNEWNHR